jgi:ribosomal protein S18 acetylase RimI-like enzyme
LTLVREPERKARVLQALMEKYQPEGRHAEVRADDPLYAKAVRGLLVCELPLDDVECKAKLGQNREPAERVRVIEHLWRRGAPDDVRAIALLVDRFPELARPAFLAAPPGLRLACHLEGAELDEATSLLEGAYWLTGQTRAAVRAALAASTALVSARDDASGRLVGFARAVSDGKVAWIYDVIVAPGTRESGVGRAVMKLLLDHPAVRGARHVRLGTRDAMPFYRRLGFVATEEAPPRPWKTTEMIRALV